MQQTPLCPLPQGKQIWATRITQVINGEVPFTVVIANQSLVERPYVTDVYAISRVDFAIDAKHAAYVCSRVNIYVLLLSDVHCFFSLRYESDFSVDAGSQPLIEAEQLNFWKYPNLSTNNDYSALYAPKAGVIQ